MAATTRYATRSALEGPRAVLRVLSRRHRPRRRARAIRRAGRRSWCAASRKRRDGDRRARRRPQYSVARCVERDHVGSHRTQRIDVRGTTRRNPRREPLRRRLSNTATPTNVTGSRSLTPKSRFLSTREHRVGPNAAEQHPGRRQRQPTANDHADDPIRTRAERDPDTDLTRALLHRVGDDAIDADDRQHHREDRRTP